MTPQTFTLGKAIVIKWLDSAAVQGWQYDPHSGSVGTMYTIAYVVNCKPDCLTVTSTFASDIAHIDPLSIPWGAITEIKELPSELDRFKPKLTAKAATV